jgi:hypothetical protein
MDMAMLTFDTYAFIQTMKDAGIPEEQAKAIALGLQKIDLSHVATKQDISDLRAELKGDIKDVKIDIIKWILSLLLGQTAVFAAIVNWMR